MLLLPSRAENTSVVLADAASFGLPALASDTGGMRTMVHDGVNGQILPLDASPAAYADAILHQWSDPDGYLKLVASSRRRYEADFCWDKNMDRILHVMAS